MNVNLKKKNPFKTTFSASNEEKAENVENTERKIYK